MKGEQEMMNLNTALEEYTKGRVAALTAEIETKLREEMRCRNRHEAYGIASEHLAELTRATKDVKNSVGDLLDTLPDPNRPAVEATSAIHNAAEEVAIAALMMTSVMAIVMQDLYSEESIGGGDDFPIGETDGDFEEV